MKDARLSGHATSRSSRKEGLASDAGPRKRPSARGPSAGSPVAAQRNGATWREPDAPGLSPSPVDAATGPSRESRVARPDGARADGSPSSPGLAGVLGPDGSPCAPSNGAGIGRSAGRNGGGSRFGAGGVWIEDERRFGARVAERLRFVGAFLRRPTSVGAISPSSAALAREMLEGCALGRSDTVVELGPGTGAFTRLILERIGQQTTFFALELDEGLCRTLERRFPSLSVHNDSAENIAEYLDVHGKSSADCILSGLPWASLPMGVQDRIFEAVLSSLKPGGIFATFGYVHARWFPNAQKFRRRLEASFAEVRMSRVVWKNFPPAFIYRCRR